MPCWEANIMAIEFSTRHEDVFQSALEKSGLKMVKDNWNGENIWIVGPKDQMVSIAQDPIVIWPDHGQVKSQPGYESYLATLRQNYSLAAVEKAAKASKWSISLSKNNEREVRVRRY